MTDHTPQDLNLNLAHFSSKEIEEMNETQGGESLLKNGIPEFTALFKKIQENPEIADQLFRSIDEHNEMMQQMQQPQGSEQQLAKGGQPNPEQQELQQMQSEGQMGDDRLAYIPVGLMNILDSKIGAPSINPKTGLRQYWMADLMGMLGKAGQAFNTYAKPIMNYFGGQQPRQYGADVPDQNPFREAGGNANPFQAPQQQPQGNGWMNWGKSMLGSAGSYLGKMAGKQAGGYGGAAMGNMAANMLPPGISHLARPYLTSAGRSMGQWGGGQAAEYAMSPRAQQPQEPQAQRPQPQVDNGNPFNNVNYQQTGGYGGEGMPVPFGYNYGAPNVFNEYRAPEPDYSSQRQQMQARQAQMNNDLYNMLPPQRQMQQGARGARVGPDPQRAIDAANKALHKERMRPVFREIRDRGQSQTTDMFGRPVINDVD